MGGWLQHVGGGGAPSSQGLLAQKGLRRLAACVHTGPRSLLRSVIPRCRDTRQLWGRGGGMQCIASLRPQLGQPPQICCLAGVQGGCMLVLRQSKVQVAQLFPLP